MTDSNPSIPLESLLEHSGWLTELARRLVRDPNAADDLAQSTWLAALEHRPHDGRPVRQWLATVMRNFARQEARGRARRQTREEQAARAEAQPSTGTLVERAAMHKEIVGAVLMLDEPYRSAILMRFFEERSPRDIALELGIPVNTVHTRIARGLDRLRVRLDTTHGGNRAAWVALAMPLAERSLPMSPPALGTLLMNAKLKAVLAGLSVVCALAVWIAVRDASPTPAIAGPSVRAEPLSDAQSAPAGLEVAPAGDARSREIAAASDVTTDRKPSATNVVSPKLVHGRVLDEHGQPAGGVTISFASSGESGDPALHATSAASGVFEMAEPTQPGRFVATDATLATVLSGLFSRGIERIEPIVVVARRVPLAGRVVDEQGFALEGARVTVEIGANFRTRFREVLDHSVAQEWIASSDAAGAFALAAVPAVDDARIRASAPGFDVYETPVPALGDRGLLITLTRPRATDGTVRGRVLGPSGAPLAAAYVSFGIDSTKSDDEGKFSFRIDDERSLNHRMHVVPTSLIAVARGLQAARFDAPKKDGAPEWPAEVTLRLTREPLEITGRVVGSDGAPFEGARVWIADATMFGAIGDGPAHVENMLVGAEGEFWHYVVSDSQGRFRIEGLLDREYRVRAQDERTLLRTQVGPIRAGSRDVEIRFVSGLLHPRVAGRVVSHAGAPLAGVRVFPMCDAFQARLEGQVVGTSHDGLEGVVTDADGHFELVDVPKSLVYLRIEGEQVIPLEYGRVTEGAPSDPDAAFSALPKDAIEELTIIVDQRCHVQIELADPSIADEFAVLDEQGQEVVISLFAGNSRQETERVPVVDGRSAALALADRGRTIVLYLAGREVMRAPIALRPGALQTVRL